MDTRWIQPLILSIMCMGNYHWAECASVMASIAPSPAVIGASSPLSVRCSFTVDAGEQFQQMFLFSESQTESIALLFGTNKPSWTIGASDAWSSRGYLSGSQEQGFMVMVLNDTQCDDNGDTYRCRLQYSSTFIQNSVTVQVEAAPQAPSPMVVNPPSENATEFTNMTFQCSGNVGRPAGTFQWFTFVGSVRQNVTDQAVQEGATVASDGCTSMRTSNLTLNLSRTEATERLVVRCRVYHPSLGNSDDSACSNPDVDFCRMSQQISVQYPASVSVTSDTMSKEEGQSVSFVCSTWGNPVPYPVEWRREGENEPLAMQNKLTLSNLTLNDTGNYVCTASNTIAGKDMNDSVTVSLTVAETTTPSTTTTPQTTTPDANTTTPELPNKGAAGGDDTTIIIVVVVVVVVVLIVAVVVIVIFIRRRNSRKEVEEPPEKPFNNNAGINTVAGRPDLVRNAYANNPPMKNEDSLAYAELQFDNKPRSRRPLAFDDTVTDYSDVSMPQV